MKNVICAAAAAAALLCVGAIEAAAETATPEMFGALPTVREAVISPDGATVAMLQNAGGSAAIVFYNLADSAAKPAATGVGDVKARDIVWADNDHLLVLITQTFELTTSRGLQTAEMGRWVSVSRSRGKATLLFGNEPGYYITDPGYMISTLPDEGKHAVFTRWTSRARMATGNSAGSRMQGDSGFGYSLFKVNLDSGDADAIANGEEDTVDWIVDPAGEPVVRIDFDGTRVERKVFSRQAGSRFQLVSTIKEQRGHGSSIQFYGLSPNPGKLLATTTTGGDKRALIEFDLATGESGAVLFQNHLYDIDGIVYDADRATATGVRYTDDLPRTFHLAAADQKLQTDLTAALAGATPMITSWSADKSRMIVRAIYTDHPDQIFIFDRTARRLDMLTPTYAGLDGKVFAQKEKYDYTSSDGLSINGYLTVPAGAAKAAMPLIVLPHGGPAGRDDQGFDWWSFFYAARGYLVYQPNFRGSDGYGEAFEAAGYGEWGRKMQDDISEGVRKLVADGYVDPARVCIVGGSYGGYAALAGATLTPDLYACAVSVNGVTNLPGMIGETARTSELAEDYWDVHLGSRFRDAKALAEVSPVENAHKAKAPILLIHARGDTVVPFGQALQMRDALKAAGRSHEFVELAGEDHWLSRGETRTEMLAKSIEFIDRHIGPKD